MTRHAISPRLAIRTFLNMEVGLRGCGPSSICSRDEARRPPICVKIRHWGIAMRRGFRPTNVGLANTSRTLYLAAHGKVLNVFGIAPYQINNLTGVGLYALQGLLSCGQFEIRQI